MYPLGVQCLFVYVCVSLCGGNIRLPNSFKSLLSNSSVKNESIFDSVHAFLVNCILFRRKQSMLANSECSFWYNRVGYF